MVIPIVKPTHSQDPWDAELNAALDRLAAVSKADVGLDKVPNVDATNRLNHTGTQTSSTISDFNNAVSAIIAGGNTVTTGPVTAPDPYDAAVIADSPLLYLPLADFNALANPVTAVDYSGHGRSGTYGGSILPGVTNTAAQSTVNHVAMAFLDGITNGLGAGHVTVPHDPSFNLSTATTARWAIVGMVGNRSTDTYKDVMGKGDATTNGWLFFLGQDGSMGFKICGTQYALPTLWTPTAGLFQQIGVRFDGANIQFMVNGNVAGTAAVTVANTATTTSPLNVGSDSAGSNITLDNVALFGTALATSRFNDYWVAFAGTSTSSSPVNTTGATLLFEDDFLGTTLDHTKWEPNRYGTNNGGDGGFNPTSEDAFFADAQVSVSGSNLVITMVPYPGGKVLDNKTYHYVSGVIQSFQHGLRFQPGRYIEGKFNIPTGVGLWPAFWGRSVTRWPPEIDIFEFWGTGHNLRPTFNYISPDQTNTGTPEYGPNPGTSLHGSMHTYGCWWKTDNTITPYIDGVAVTSLAVSGVELDPQGIIVNMSLIAGNTPPNPSVLLCDYIRMWDKPYFT